MNILQYPTLSCSTSTTVDRTKYLAFLVMKHILSSLLPYTSSVLARLAEPSEAKPGLLPSFWNRLTDYLSVLKYCHIALVVASGGEIPPMLKTLDLAAAAAAAACGCRYSAAPS